MTDFKISKKEVHSDSRSSVMEKHDSKIKQLSLEFKKLPEYRKELEKCKDSIRFSWLQKKINDIENETELNEYLFNLMDFLKEEESKEKISTKNKEEGIHKFISLGSETNMGTIYDNYMQKCYGYKKNNNFKSSFICQLCNSTTINSGSEGLTICYTCGNTEKLNLSMTPEWNSFENHDFIKPFSYKRSNHFKEWINQIQGREGTNIPNDILIALMSEIKKERLYDKKLITYDKIKSYLKKLKLSKYYEHIPNIIHKLTGNRQLIISVDLEKTLVNMFSKVQEPFQKHCPINRKNFLSYSYTLYKFFQILNMEEYLVYFPLLKSREKLFEQEDIWKKICKDLDWKFIRCI